MSELSIKRTSTINYFKTASGAFAVSSFAALPISTTFTDVFLGLAIFFMLLSGNLKQTLRIIINNKIAQLFLIFFALFLFGALYSTAPIHDITKMLTKNAKLLYGALLIPVFIPGKWREHSITVLLATLSVIMILSYLKVFGVINITARYQDAAVFKSHIQTNFLMAFYCYLLAVKCVDDKARQYFWIALLVAAALKTVVFSEGRSGYVVFAALMILFGWQRFSFKGIVISTLGVALLCSSAFLFSHSFQQRFNKAITDTHLYQKGNAKTSVGLRISFYSNAIKLIKKRLIFGYGTGSLHSQYKLVQRNTNLQTDNVHNEYLNVAIQLGLVGFTFLLFFFSSIYFKSFMLPQQHRELAQATVIAIAIGCLFNSWLMDTMQGHFFAMMIALCFSSWHKKS